MADGSEVVDKILAETADESIVLKTKHGELTFTLNRLPRRQRVETMRALPDELLQNLGQVQDSDAETAAEVADEIGVTSSMIPSGAAIDKLDDAIATGLDSPTLIGDEIVDLFEHADDEIYMGVAFWVLGKSADVDGVESFREK
ncbi:hypothetical protein J2752_000455 [Halarchaeum rubridurum]|uniref:Uncharacterized protein n=1 Tax=Halarchaeum rubridurum TaxID=489911 RepID=A0A830FRE6_9EURY|nr:hypothetical protein [Halarchaeum rubridurum]MBP1953574.1 hypothetical protein [Halarchaeum rubridurum]GGM64270.1 hypothetical protein GCM10009017_12870 [Halarchaeum rubridurum]